MSHQSRNSTLVVFGDSLSDNGNLFDLLADGRGDPVSGALSHLLQTADHWNLLTA